MNENPTAVISGANLGAPRSGRYATRSISRLSDPQTNIETISVSSSPAISPSGPGGEASSPSEAPQSDPSERADHENVAVGEVDQLDDPVHERVPDRDQRPDRAVREAPGQEVEAQVREVVVDDRVASLTDVSPDLVALDRSLMP